MFTDQAAILAAALQHPGEATEILGAISCTSLRNAGKILQETATFNEILANSLQETLISPLSALTSTTPAKSTNTPASITFPRHVWQYYNDFSAVVQQEEQIEKKICASLLTRPVTASNTTGSKATAVARVKTKQLANVPAASLRERLQKRREECLLSRHDMVTSLHEAVSNMRIASTEAGLHTALALNNWAQQLGQVVHGTNAAISQVR